MPKRARGRPQAQDKNNLSDQQIFTVVLKTFSEQGFKGTSIRDIARQLDVSHNLLPQRYGSKEQLWYLAVADGFKRFVQQLEAAADERPGDNLVKLKHLLSRSIELTAASPYVLRIIQQEAIQASPRLDYLFETVIKPSLDFSDQWFKTLAERGVIKPVSPGFLYFLVTHGAAGMFAMPALAAKVAAQDSTLEGLNQPQQIDRFIDLIISALKP